MYECYDNVIGLSEKNCECINSGRPEDYSKSKSGLFLDEIAPLKKLLNIQDCGETNIWTHVDRAISVGTTNFVKDTNALLVKSGNAKLKRKPVKRQVLGQIKAKDVASTSKNYAVIEHCCAPIRGGYMTLHEIGGVFEASGSVTVQLRNSVDPDTVMESWTLTTIADKHVKTPVDLELPLYSKYDQPLKYFYTYLIDQNNGPKDTKVDCGCGDPLVFSRENPYYFHGARYRNALWSQYLMVGGTQINSLSELDDNLRVTSNKAYGLTFELSFGCKIDEVLCEDSLDFQANPLALSMAEAVRYAAWIYLANTIINSSELSAETVLDRDFWENKVMEWVENYNNQVTYIVEQADYTANDCLECDSVLSLTRSGLFA